MKPTGKKIILTILLAVVLVIAYCGIITLLNHFLLSRERPSEDVLTQDAVAHTLTEIDGNLKEAEMLIRERYKVAATISAMALRKIVDSRKDNAIAQYSSGAVVKVQNGSITAPEDIEQRFGLTADLFKGKQGFFSSPEDPETLIVYCRIHQPYYYIEWYVNTDLLAEIEKVTDIPGILQKAEVTYNVCALCVANGRSEENETKILYKNEVFSALDETFQETGGADASIEESGVSPASKSGTLSLPTGSFHYVSRPIPSINGYLVLMRLQPSLYFMAFSHSTYMFSALILFLAVLLMTGFSLYSFIQKNELTPGMEKRYHPSNVRRFASLCGIIGMVCIFLSGMLIYSLNDLYDDTAKGKESLQRISQSLSMYTERYRDDSDRYRDAYVEYGSHIAELLNSYPELREKSVLETLAESINAVSITLYDAAGEEITSSGDYVGLVLSKDANVSTCDFRRLLHGVQTIVHEKDSDETTGETGLRIGIRLNDPTSESGYNAMLLTVGEGSWVPNLAAAQQTVLENLSGTDTIHFIADGKTGVILGSSREALTGKNISVLGLNENDLSGSLIKTVNTEEGSFFITSSVLTIPADERGAEGTESIIAYYAVRKTPTQGFWISPLAGALLFLAVYALLVYLTLGGYTDEFFEKNKHMRKAGQSAATGWKGILHRLSAISPERAGFIIMEVIVALYLTQLIPISNFRTPLERNSVFYYITSGNWEKGLNLFALSAILILLGEILMSVILVRLLLTACSTFVGGKAQTILRLIRSLVMYVALITFLIIACTYIGVSMTAIIAFIGTLGISISLGAQDFIADIIAGLTIVFEGTFHVGDIVDLIVSGTPHHGEVSEIGLRFTKLRTSDSNIVTLSNRDITIVNNMTQTNSQCVCEISVFSDYPIDEVEAMLAKELPKLAAENRRILAGPFYKGITALGSGSMTLSIVTECSERDLSNVRQFINRSLQKLFTQNGYQI